MEQDKTLLDIVAQSMGIPSNVVLEAANNAYTAARTIQDALTTLFKDRSYLRLFAEALEKERCLRQSGLDHMVDLLKDVEKEKELQQSRQQFKARRQLRKRYKRWLKQKMKQ